jgi:YhcH/YjgK/YiaL family protein
MAIIGKIEDILKQLKVSDNQQKGLKYLQEKNLADIFESIEVGKAKVIEIEGKEVFAVFSKYETKENSKTIFEKHKKYIDIQYITKGEEKIYVTSENLSILQDYSEENDCELGVGDSYSSFLLVSGVAAILFPEDWHAPGQFSTQTKQVEKVVIKIAV